MATLAEVKSRLNTIKKGPATSIAPAKLPLSIGGVKKVPGQKLPLPIGGVKRIGKGRATPYAPAAKRRIALGIKAGAAAAVKQSKNSSIA